MSHIIENYLKKSFLALITYEVLTLVISPENGSSLKSLISVFFVGSFILLAIYFFKSKKELQNNFKPIYAIWLVLITLGVVNIFRSFEFNTQNLITLFGNKNTGLAMMLPLALMFGLKFKNIVWFNKICINMLKMGLVLIFMSLFNTDLLEFSSFFLQFSLIPLILFSYQKVTDKTIIVFASIGFILLGVYQGDRLPVLQIIFLWMGLFVFHFYAKMKLKRLRNIVLVILLSFPFIILVSRIPIFEYLNDFNKIEVGKSDAVDTRTFLYIEVFEDMEKNEALVLGKGAMGKYYSDYFAQADGDNEKRLNVEVGFLSMLLKGGILNTILNFLILLISVFIAFKSANKFSQRLSILVVCHVLSLFISDIPQYSTFNFSIWLAIGGCASLSVRRITETEVKFLFNNINRKQKRLS